MKVKTKVAIVFNKQKIIQYSIKYLTFTVGLAMAIVLIFPANAETERSQYSSLTNIDTIEVGNDGRWQFSSEAKSISIKDEIAELDDYSIVEAERKLEPKTVVNQARWGNRGDVADFSLDTNVYEY